MHGKYLRDRYNIYNEMNHGRYAIVYRAVDKRNGREVAIKVINKYVLKQKDLSEEYLENEKTVFDLLHEIDRCKRRSLDGVEKENDGDMPRLWSKNNEHKGLRGTYINEDNIYDDNVCGEVQKSGSGNKSDNSEPSGRNNVIRFYGYHTFNSAEYIVMELIDGYDMQREVFERFNIKNRVQYTFAERIEIMLQLIQGVKYLHSKNIYHLDLKPENIMLANDRVVIVDFGCAFHSRRGREKANKFFMKGTPGFCPPEITDMEVLDRDIELAKIDVWALCCSFYYLFEGKLPFRDDNYNDVRFNEVVVALRYDKDCKDEVYNICEKVFVDEPEYRLSLDEFREEIVNMEECS